jgi:hypothetical protein
MYQSLHDPDISIFIFIPISSPFKNLTLPSQGTPSPIGMNTAPSPFSVAVYLFPHMSHSSTLKMKEAGSSIGKIKKEFLLWIANLN